MPCRERVPVYLSFVEKKTSQSYQTVPKERYPIREQREPYLRNTKKSFARRTEKRERRAIWQTTCAVQA